MTEVDRFDYELPDHLVAAEPADRRDESRMLVLDRTEDAVTHSTFAQLPQFLRDGDLVVLNFWASWCRPCVEEIPVFTELQDDFGDQGLQMLGVAVDNRDAARDFSERLDMNYPSFQGTTSGMELVEAYGNERGTLPYTVVIDRDGTIVHRFDREIEREDIEPVIRKHL